MPSFASLRDNQRRQGHLPHAPRPTLSKEARDATNARRQELRTAYTNSVQALALEVKDKVSSIAVEHKKSCDAVQAALNVGSGAFNKGRHAKASPWHAFLWKKAQVERDEGSKAKAQSNRSSANLVPL
jgi:hypothetical protein